MNKKRAHHYVWRHYLLAWAAGQHVPCLREGVIFRPNVAGIAQKKDFYRLRSLSRFENFLVDGIIRASPEALQKSHRLVFDNFKRVVEAYDKLLASGRLDAAKLSVLDTIVNNLEEELHSGIENRAVPVLSALRSGDCTFIQDDQLAICFCHFIAMQMLRTRKVQKSFAEAMDRIGFVGASNAIQPLRHIFASNVGWSIFAQRQNWKLEILEAQSGSYFITSDQPVVNLLGAEEMAPESMELFYPISPRRALRLSFEEAGQVVSTCSISSDQVERLNDFISRESGDLLFAKTEVQLRRYLVREK